MPQEQPKCRQKRRGIRIEDRGEQHLKGVPDAWHLFALAAG